MADRQQVIIVGGGPVGVALAVDLGLRGVTCTVVERHTEPQRIPKGQNLTQRTLEHFYFWGLIDEARGARVMPNKYPIGGVTAYKNMMSEYWFAPPGRELVQSYYYEENDRMPQYQLEAVLRDKMAMLPTVTGLFGHSAKRIAQDADGVRVTVVDEGSPHDESVLEADYVVGCDGGHSLVREQVGIERRGSDFDQKMLLAVFRSKDLHQAFERFPERTTYRAMDPELEGYWLFFGRVDVGEGWFFHAPVPLETTTDNYDFQALLNRAAGFEFNAEFEHVGFWDLKVAVADRYQAGRVFIAGDAAHSHPPYGGFGLNNGLEDVVNLGWKLAAKLEGWGGEALLESYSEERRPIFWETGEDFIAAGINADREFLGRYSPEQDRAEFEEAWDAMAAKSRMSVYEPNYEGSSVVLGPDGGVCSAHGTHTFTARVGHHLPPVRLSSGRGVHEEFGTGFTLLAFGADDHAVSAFEQAAQSANVPLKVVRDSYGGGREAYEARMILVRPDQYVVWCADEAPGDAGSVMRTVVGVA
jgi:2-polyprenyl-6-methoxyphenol hydroxylase-like FAD-dependent oxidoreductase